MKINNDFVLGINYWPIKKAMYWWQNFDLEEVNQDFARLTYHNFQVIRIFLTWEDFQPQPDTISPLCLDNLQRTADIAAVHKLQIMPTFFCGHMSGVNWMPPWMLTTRQCPCRFPVYSNGKLQQVSIRNFYNDNEVIEAQILQIEKVCLALKDHEAIYAYDLGNESSNCVVPYNRRQAQEWLQQMSSTVRKYSNSDLLTIGMHAEDLEENRNLSPEDASLYCDFLSMHGYPFYLSWADNHFDAYILPFLGIITRWLGNNKPVLFQEFGAPSKPVIPPLPGHDYRENLKCVLWDEQEVNNYYCKTLQLLYQENMLGAFAWCFADYFPELWDKPPLKVNLHERHFGLFRHDSSAKPAADIFSEIKNNPGAVKYEPDNNTWLADFDRHTFYDNPKENLRKMYARYKHHWQEL